MKKSKRKLTIKNNTVVLLMCTLSIAVILCGCGNSTSNIETTVENDDINADTVENEGTEAIENESATDAHIDFASIQAENSEIFAWLEVPGTGIDCPVLQSQISDDYYRNHNAHKEDDALGSAYIEQPVMPDMCDFNTVIHGSGKGVFKDLVNFENPDFFKENELFYIYLPDNQLTYEVFAVYERNNTSLIREYSFAEAKGDREFLYEVYQGKFMGKLLREGWEDINEYNFLTTLTIDENDSNKQLVVIGVLVSDAAGTIDRQVIEELDIGPNLLEQ